MTAVTAERRTVPVPRHAAEDLLWLAPAAVWDASPMSSAALTAPRIIEFSTDRFIDELRATVAGSDGRSPADLDSMAPAEVAAGTAFGTGPYRLFQPLSQRYYLVVASLVCRRPGVPDHQLSAAEHDRASFVMRRLEADGSESAFVAGQWRPAWPASVAAGEKRYPLHTVPVAGFAEPGTPAAILGLAAGEPSRRQVFYGYVPVTVRDTLVPPLADPGQALLDLQASMPLPNPPEHPGVDELIGRVVRPWIALRDAPAGSNTGYASLMCLLDLLDWLGKHVPEVRDALVAGSALPPGPNHDLLAALDAPQVAISTPPGTLRLSDALRELVDFLPLVTGVDIPGPVTGYNLVTPTPPAAFLSGPATPGSLASVAGIALRASGRKPQVPPELAGLVKADPVSPPRPSGGSPANPRYVIRTVLEHEPCCPAVSGPTRAFELARPMDADAPARKILLQLPDIDNLRSFKRGVAIEMPPSLRRMLDRVTPDMLKGSGLGQDPGLALGMICSFSLQIIFLVAFIVMFIFLILLNIVFWWLPFLKICFPIPVRPATPKGPTP